MSLTVRDLRQAVGQIVFQIGGDVAQVVFDDGQITGSVIAVFKLRAVCVEIFNSPSVIRLRMYI